MSDPLKDEIGEALDSLHAQQADRTQSGLAAAMRRFPEALHEQDLRQRAVALAVQFSAAPGKGGNIHEMLKWASEINEYLVDGSLKGEKI